VRSKANRKKRFNKHWENKGYTKKAIKFYKFLCKVKFKMLKDYEADIIYWEINHSGWLRDLWQPLVYISQEYINKVSKEQEDVHVRSVPFIRVWVHWDGSNPYRGNGFTHQPSKHEWHIVKPGYYRLHIRRKSYLWNQEMKYLVHEMFYHKGMPAFNPRNARCYVNAPTRAFHKLNYHYEEIKKQKLAEKQAIKDRKEDTYNRLKNKRIMQNIMERERNKERASRVRGITPTRETVAFFQALAVGSVISEK
tara:strand:+ start:741 stop:1493 length:753 start_codon:yes stop_codon:yes gene_type:complete